MATIKAFSAQETADLSNEWMRRFIEEPEAFQAQFKTVNLFLAEENAGVVPTYGDQCVAFMEFLRIDIAAKFQAIAVENSAVIDELMARHGVRHSARKSKSKSKRK